MQNHRGDLIISQVGFRYVLTHHDGRREPLVFSTRATAIDHAWQILSQSARLLARIIHEGITFSRNTNAPVWYKGRG